MISEDVFPEIATELGRLTNPLVIAPLRALVGFYLRRADHVVAIGERMRERLIAKGAPPERVIVIPNWVDTASITPQPAERVVARAGLDGRFVVMHSGNVGHAQNLDNADPRDDPPSRPRRAVGSDHRLRRPQRASWSSWRRSWRRTRCGSCRTSRASASASRSRQRARPLRRARARALGLRRSEPPLRDPLGRSPGHRRGGRGQRDGGARE